MAGRTFNIRKTVIITLIFVAFIFIFYLFAYNSGYGYDALENLVIGRSLVQGYSFYTFTPSKPWAFYYLVSLFLYLNKTASHVAITAFVTCIYFLILSSTFLFTRKLFNQRTAFISLVLIGVGCYFMEMHFLLCESMVYILALAGFYAIIYALEKNNAFYFIIGGLFFGNSFSFKTTAGLYILATLLFITFWGYFKLREQLASTVKKITFIICGVLLAVIFPVLYFVSTGRGQEYFTWTYYYPLFKYYCNEDWSYKLYTQLLWFDLMVSAMVILSLRRDIRKSLYSMPGFVYLLFIGVVSLVPIFKSPSPHFVFPGGTFLIVFSAVVIDMVMGTQQIKKKLIVLGGAVFLFFCLSLFLYKPAALNRLLRVNDYTDEKQLGDFIQAHSRAGRRVLFFRDSIFLYWVSGRYPNIPWIYTEPLFTYCIDKRPQRLLDALNDPALDIVEFDRSCTGIIDKRFFDKKEHRELIDNFYSMLKQNFIPLKQTQFPYVFWVRKDMVK